LSTWAPLGGSCEFHSRRGQAGSTGYAYSARYRGGLLFGDFSLGRTRESHRRPEEPGRRICLRVLEDSVIHTIPGRRQSRVVQTPTASSAMWAGVLVCTPPHIHISSYPHHLISTPPRPRLNWSRSSRAVVNARRP